MRTASEPPSAVPTTRRNEQDGAAPNNTGKIFPGRPALGSWVSYALGSENQNLPAYIVLRDPEGFNTSGSLLWQNGWLPALYRGTEVSTKGTPVQKTCVPKRRCPTTSSATIFRSSRGSTSSIGSSIDFDSDLEVRIRNYELAALIKDLKQRGLLDDTIVIWSGEFGRLPISQNGSGRDHNRNAFSLMLAGGGFKRGYVHGATDEVGYRAVEKRVSVQDLHATILGQLGLDHDRLSFRHRGRSETLTDSPVTKARVATDLVEQRSPA